MSEEEIIKIDFIKKQYEKLEKMNEEEIETIKYIESGINTYIENTKVNKIVISEEQAKILLNLIEKLEKEQEKEKEKNKN